MNVWPALLAACAGCFLLKLAGLSLPQRVLDAAVVRRVSALLPVALLASLVAVQAVAAGPRLAADARLASLVVAAAALALRAPFLVVIALAAVTAAALRQLG